MPVPRILFVDDDSSGRELAAFILGKAGYEIDLATRGEDALQQFAQGQYHLVVTDLRMPGINGLEVLRAVKQRAPTIPVLIITAFASVEDVRDAMKSGADAVIGKPFDRHHLLSTVERALGDAKLP